MSKFLPLKNFFLENRQHSQRVIAAFCLVLFFMLGVLLSRLLFLQVFHHKKYVSLSHDNRVGVIPIPPIRGLIFDRNGNILAQNRPTFTLEVVPERIVDLESTLNELQKVIPIRDEDVVRFHRIKKQKRVFDSVPLKHKLSEEEVARFSVEQHRFPGVSVEARLSRFYPHGDLFAHVLGYVGRINRAESAVLDEKRYRATQYIGKIGIERSFEDQLVGFPGYQHVEMNARRRIVEVLERTPPIRGDDVFLTLDADLQRITHDALGDHRGAAVVIDTKSGAVLAMVSTPSYDPNLFINGIDSATFHALSHSIDKPLFNRVLKGRYPPGSTIKPFIGLAGLEYGVITPEYSIEDPGWFQLPNNPDYYYRDWKNQGHGLVNLDKAIAQSCDTYFYNLSHRLGITKIHDFMFRFGFGQLTQIDFKDEEARGLLPSAAWKKANRKEPWYPGETLITGIGQGFMLVTPLQLASAIATLANKGKRLKPFVVDRIESDDSQVSQSVPSVLSVASLKYEKHWNIIHSAMVNVVHSPMGTARRLRKGLSYTMAGKSGTSQVFGIKQDEKYKEQDVELRLRDHALFVAFAPADDPQVVAIVIVENGGGGSKTAAPIVRKMLDAFFEVQG